MARKHLTLAFGVALFFPAVSISSAFGGDHGPVKRSGSPETGQNVSEPEDCERMQRKICRQGDGCDRRSSKSGEEGIPGGVGDVGGAHSGA